MNTVAILLFACALLADDVWTPPENPDPQEILNQASDDARNGRHATALAKHLWYHENALKYSPAQSGVRLSFALMYWKKLGEDYPKALEVLEQIREETGQRDLASKVPAKDFADFAAINRELEKKDETVKVFQKLQLKDEKLAKSVFAFAKPALVEGKHYELLLHHLNPEADLAQHIIMYNLGTGLSTDRDNQDLLDFYNRKFANDAATLIAILTLAEDTDTAKKIAQQAKKFRDDPELHKAIDEALEGKVPKPFP